MMEVLELGVASLEDELRCVLLVGIESDEEDGGMWDSEVLRLRIGGQWAGLVGLRRVPTEVSPPLM